MYIYISISRSIFFSFLNKIDGSILKRKFQNYIEEKNSSIFNEFHVKMAITLRSSRDLRDRKLHAKSNARAAYRVIAHNEPFLFGKTDGKGLCRHVSSLPGGSSGKSNIPRNFDGARDLLEEFKSFRQLHPLPLGTLTILAEPVT